MKHIKLFEDMQSELKVGDYVFIVPDRFDLSKGIVGNNIGPGSNTGRVIRIFYKPISVELNQPEFPSVIKVKFEDSQTGFYPITRIDEFAKTKEELELKIQMKKYNL